MIFGVLGTFLVVTGCRRKSVDPSYRRPDRPFFVLGFCDGKPVIEEILVRLFFLDDSWSSLPDCGSSYSWTLTDTCRMGVGG